jgi:hypothetical protein
LNSQKISLSNNIYLAENCKQESKGQTKTGKRDPTGLSFISETPLSLSYPGLALVYTTLLRKKRLLEQPVVNRAIKGVSLIVLSVEKFSQIIPDTDIILMSNGR